VVVAITRFKLVAYNACKKTGTELFNVFHCDEFNCKFKECTRNGCVYKGCKLLLIESCLFLEVSQKVEKTTAVLSITSLHIMCQKECKNAFLKFKSIANNRQFCHISNVVHKCTINFFFVRVAVDMPLTNSSLLLHTYLSISWNSDCEKWYKI